MPIPGLSLFGALDKDQAIAYMASQSVMDGARALSAWQVARAKIRSRAAPAPARILALPPSCDSHLVAVRSQPRFEKTYSGAPFEFGLAEIEGLRACQLHVAVATPKYDLAPADPQGSVSDELLEMCLPTRLPEVIPKWNRIGNEDVGSISYYCGDQFEFRILGAGPSLPDHVEAVQGVGIVIGVGFGLVLVIRAGDVLYLANGYHRTINLMLSGHRYVPCIVQTVAPGTDVPAVFKLPHPMLSQASPPITCRDYRLAARIQLRRHHRVINLTWAQTLVPDE